MRNKYKSGNTTLLLSMKTYLFTLGLHEDFAIRRLVSTNASKDDDIVILIKSPISAGIKRALNALNAVTLKMGLKDPVVREVEISESIFQVVRKIGEILNGLKDPLVVDVSGGESKALMLGVILSLVIYKRIGRIYVEEDEDFYFSVEEFRTAVEGIGSETEVVLNNVVEAPGIKLEELAEKTGKKLKTVMNEVGLLKKKRLVYQKGRGEGVYPTTLGIVVNDSLRNYRGKKLRKR